MVTYRKASLIRFLLTSMQSLFIIVNSQIEYNTDFGREMCWYLDVSYYLRNRRNFMPPKYSQALKLFYETYRNWEMGKDWKTIIDSYSEFRNAVYEIVGSEINSDEPYKFKETENVR